MYIYHYFIIKKKGENMNKVKAYRVMANLRQVDMAEKLGLSKQAYGSRERGQTNFTIEEMKKVKEIFETVDKNISIDEIFF